VTLFAAEGGRAVLAELSVMEQRYHAVMEVISGAPVTEVAGLRSYPPGRARMAGQYQEEGLAGLADHSHRPHFQPRQLAADVEAMICQLRGAHPRWVRDDCSMSSAKARWHRCRPGRLLPGSRPPGPGPGP
jgi:hypothetical protein